MNANVEVYGGKAVPAEQTSTYGITKRAFDVVVAAAILLFLLPVFLSLSAAVASQGDRGPIFFGQRRIGRNGHAFRCLKFRSMCINADQLLERMLQQDPIAREEWLTTGKLRNDPRISRVGRILRSTSLDELPQLWNVLRGDMSLVGPRPITRKELDGPYTTFGGRTEYLSVRPGITGLWQVSGRSSVGYRQRVALDVDYVRSTSLVCDLRIILRTFGVVMLRKGAC